MLQEYQSIGWKPTIFLTGVAVAALTLTAIQSPAAQAGLHPATGVGSCTLKGWNPNTDPEDAKYLPIGDRPQSYKPADYDCTGAKFAAPGVEFAKFPQPKNFQIGNVDSMRQVKVCSGGKCTEQFKSVEQPTAAVNPLAPYFPPFQHFVVIYRENHTFDDYLGDCATTVIAGCNGQTQSTNHISSVPNLHSLAKAYGLDDSYSTGTQPPSGPNHWWLFSAQSSSSSSSSPTHGHRNAVRPLPQRQRRPHLPFIMNGDFYWMLSSGSGYWRNPATGKLEVLPVDRPGTTIPEELHYNEYTCNNQSIPDSTVANDYINFINTNGMPAYNYVELFNDHPDTYQDIPGNDTATNNIVSAIENNATYKNNTLIVITEDDTQNGNNGPDHVSNTYRVPLVVIGPSTYVKQHYLSHVAYTTNNVIAAMERTMENVHSGIIDPNDNLGLNTFPMTSNDQAALGDPLADFWVQSATPPSATAKGTPSTGNAPLSVAFTGSATGGTAPYSYSWNSATSTAQNPSHTYSAAGTYTATLTVTDSSSPAKTATSTVTITASPIAATVPGAPTGLTATGGTGQVSLSWQAPASNGGENITSYKVYRGTSSGTETLLTSGGCSALSTGRSCTDTGLTAGQTYYYKVSAVNGIGEGSQSNEASATVSGSGGCPSSQLLGNPGFETGTASPWTASSGVVSKSATEPPHSGTWDAWMDGYGSAHTDTVSQAVTLPTGCSNYSFSFWLHVDTAETSTSSAYDTLKVQVLNSSGTVLSTLATYSNLNHNTGYAQHSFSLASYAGQKVTLKFTGAEDYEYQTSFVLDDTAVNVS